MTEEERRKGEGVVPRVRIVGREGGRWMREVREFGVMRMEGRGEKRCGREEGER